MLSQRMSKMQFSFTLCKIKFRVQRVQKYQFRALHVSTSFRRKSEFTKSIYIKLILYNISKIYILTICIMTSYDALYRWIYRITQLQELNQA